MTQSPPTGELVARLRERRWPGKWSDIVGSDPLCIEAADAITTLERELEEERADRQSDRFDAAAQFGTERARAIRAERALTASQEEVERLKAALKQVVADYDACSGAEPSLSVLHRSIDLVARDALEPAP